MEIKNGIFCPKVKSLVIRREGRIGQSHEHLV